MSSGADTRLKIWSAENGTCPVTLTGHSAAVTQAAIIDRGMNIVSVSKWVSEIIFKIPYFILFSQKNADYIILIYYLK